jgi:hypothetical protein
MSLDRATTALAAAALLTAVAYGPLVPAVGLPADPRADQPVFEGFAENQGVGTTHQLSYRVVETPTTATVTDGTLSVPATTVAVEAGETPVTLRYQLRVGDRSVERTAVVPAGEARTVALSPTVAVEGAPSEARLRVVAATEDSSYRLHNGTVVVESA